MPEAVKDDIGRDLFQVQNNRVPASTKPLSGFGGANVLEIVCTHRADAYRAVYTVRFAERVYVLHVFQKRSKSGISTPQREIELIEARLKQATRMERESQEKSDEKKKN